MLRTPRLGTSHNNVNHNTHSSLYRMQLAEKRPTPKSDNAAIAVYFMLEFYSVTLSRLLHNSVDFCCNNSPSINNSTKIQLKLELCN